MRHFLLFGWAAGITYMLLLGEPSCFWREHRGNRMNVRSQVYETGITANLGWLDHLAWFAVLFFVATIGSKALDFATIDFLGLGIDPRLTVVALAILTVCHAFVAVHLVNSIGRGRRCIAADERERLYLEQLASGGFLVRGTHDYRNSFVTPKHPGTVQLRTDARDPAVWFQLTLAVLAIIACVPFELSWAAALYACVAVAFVSVNFDIGATWLVALADFGRPSEESLYFAGNTEQIRMKVFPISGPLVPHKFELIGDQVPNRDYVIYMVLGVALPIIPLLLIVGLTRLAVALGQGMISLLSL